MYMCVCVLQAFVLQETMLIKINLQTKNYIKIIFYMIIKIIIYLCIQKNYMKLYNLCK